MRRWIPLVLTLSGLLAPACSRERPRERAETTGAVLVGRVRLAPGARLPAYAVDDLARRELIAASGEAAADGACEAARSAALRPVAVGEDHGLAGIAVGVSDFTHYTKAGPRTHTVRLAGCRLEPATVTATVGDRLVIENRGDRTHAPVLGPTYRGLPLAPGRRVEHRLSAGVATLLCTRANPCGRTDLLTFHHPLHATTTSNGRFVIEDFPVSELVRVSAWHPLFKEARAQVWLEPGERKAVELVLQPRDR